MELFYKEYKGGVEVSDLDDLIEDVFSNTHSEGMLGLNLEDYYRFREEFGWVGHDFCYDSGALSYSRLADNKTYSIFFLGETEIKRLILLSLDTGVDHLYEACKDHPLPPFDPDVLY